MAAFGLRGLCLSIVFQTGSSSPTVAGPEWILSGRDLSVDGDEVGSARRGAAGPSGELGDHLLVDGGDGSHVWSLGLSDGRRDAFSRAVVCVEVEDRTVRRLEYFFLSLLLDVEQRIRC